MSGANGACGTRFLLYPQAPVLAAWAEPEVVCVVPEPWEIGPGPSDARMYVVDPIGKERLYGFPYLPPWDGPEHPPVEPGADGHFDHLQPGTRAFAAAHMYASVRRTLDIWQGYLGRPIPWQFARHFDRLELIPLVDWDNAHSGYGFVETGWREGGDGTRLPFALSFDVLAHEIGHSILFSEVGVPVAALRTREFLAFHESGADLAALIGVMHFDSVLDHVLRTSNGNVYLENEVNRIGELSETEQIRVASHDVTVDDVAEITFDAEGWHDPTGQDRHAHDVGLPLTGAIFDILVEVYQETLVEEGLIPRSLDDASRSAQDEPGTRAAVDAGFAAAYAGRHDAFKRALAYARDYVGYALARAWDDLAAEDLTFTRVGLALLDADAEMNGGRYARIIRASFAWRGIALPGSIWAGRPSFGFGTGLGV